MTNSKLLDIVEDIKNLSTSGNKIQVEEYKNGKKVEPWITKKKKKKEWISKKEKEIEGHLKTKTIKFGKKSSWIDKKSDKARTKEIIEVKPKKEVSSWIKKKDYPKVGKDY